MAKEGMESVKQFVSKLVDTGICDAIGDGISIQDTGFTILYQNAVHRSLLGEHIGEHCYRAYANREDVCEDCPIAIVFRDRIVYSTERCATSPKGTSRFEITASPLNDKEGTIVAAIEVVREITERKKTEETLRENEERFRAIFDASPLGIFTVDSKGHLQQINPAFQAMTGYTQDELHKGFMYITHPDDLKENLKVFNEMVEGKRDHCQIEKRYYRKDGSTMWAHLSATAIRDDNRKFKYNLVLIEDITERKEMEEKLRETAVTDELTGLFNRRGFYTLAEQQLRSAHRNNKWLSLLYLDLDELKTINDELGHKTGDQALIDTANILKRTFRESDIIARIGGDEFVVLITDQPGAEIEGNIVKHIKDNLLIFNRDGGRKYELLLSIGIAGYDPDQLCSIETLLNRADELMYEDKKKHNLEKGTDTASKDEHSERRVHKRYSSVNELTVSLEDAVLVRIKDISSGGACLRTPLELDIGRIHTINIIPPINGDIKISGMAVWSSQQGMRHYDTGLKFVEMKEGTRKSLDDLINDLTG